LIFLIKSIFGADHFDFQSPVDKLIFRPAWQVEAIDDKIELGDRIALLVVIAQVEDIEISKGRFTTSLGMPDDPFPDASFQFAFDGQCRQITGG